MFHIQDWCGQSPYDWNEFVFEVHEWNSQERLLYILVSTLPMLPLRVDDLFVLQEPISQHFPIQRVWIEHRLLLELVDVLKKCILSERASRLDFLVCENTAASLPAYSRK